MTELDGVWMVERTGGFLPPLIGVCKRIAGTRGQTALGSLPGIPFVVAGRELRYRRPLTAFVDVLEPSQDGWSGRALFQGREYGQFRLRPAKGEAWTRSKASS